MNPTLVFAIMATALLVWYVVLILIDSETLP
jgi:hypothetical protein